MAGRWYSYKTRGGWSASIQKKLHQMVPENDLPDPKMAASEVPGGSSIGAKADEVRSAERSGRPNMGEPVGDPVPVVGILVSDSIKVAQESNGSLCSSGSTKQERETKVLPPVPKVAAFLEPHHQTVPVGLISAIIGTRVIVEGSEKHYTLKEGSILWITETRSPLGLVDEIFRPVKSPYYIIRYNSKEEMAGGARVGTAISSVIESSNPILNEKDLCKKGQDASGENDDEITSEKYTQPERAANERCYENQEAELDEEPPVEMNMQPPVPCALPAMGQPLPSVLDSVQSPPVTAGFDSASCTYSIGVGSALMTAPPAVPETQPAHSYSIDPSQQTNAVLPYGFPPQQHGGYAIYLCPSPQLGNTTYPQQHQNQISSSYPNTEAYQEQFVPNYGATANVQWFDGPQIDNNRPYTMPYQQQLTIPEQQLTTANSWPQDYDNYPYTMSYQWQYIPNSGATATMSGPLDPSVVPTSDGPVGHSSGPLDLSVGRPQVYNNYPYTMPYQQPLTMPVQQLTTANSGPQDYNIYPYTMPYQWQYIPNSGAAATMNGPLNPSVGPTSDGPVGHSSRPSYPSVGRPQVYNNYPYTMPYQQQLTTANSWPQYYNNYPYTMSYQWQYIPNSGAAATMIGPLNPSVGPTSDGPVGHSSVDQARFGSNNMYDQGASSSSNAQSYGQPTQPPLAIVQRGMPPPRQSSQGMSSPPFGGRKPYEGRRPSFRQKR